MTPTTMGEFPPVPSEVSVYLFRIAQEALRNSIVHGQAQRLAVSLVASGREVELTVIDDGVGFDLEIARRESTGLGLVSMEERAHAIGGDVQIVSTPFKGTVIRVRCSVDAAEHLKTDDGLQASRTVRGYANAACAS